MDTRIYLVWYDQEDEEPLFLCSFDTYAAAAEYVKSLKENPGVIYQSGLHPANLRISIVEHQKK